MKKIFILIFLLLLTLNSFSLNSKYVIEMLHKNYDNIKTFKSNFVQFSYFKSVNMLQKYEGVLYLKRPNFMRWDYTYPEVQSIISNGEKIWYYYPSENQVNVGKLSKKSPNEINLIFMILKGVKKIEDEFNYSLIEGNDNKNFYYLQLIPKNPTTLIEKIILTIKKNTFEITQSHVFYTNGDIVKLIIKNPQKNVKIKDSFFNFTPPPGVEVYKIPTMQN